MVNFNKKVLVFGAAGLLGSATCSELLNRGHSVIAVTRPGGTKINFSSIPNLEIVEIDLQNNFDIRKLLSNSVDCIMYFPQSSGHNAFPKMSGGISEINFSSAIRVIEQAVDVGVKSFLYASTGGVYESSEFPLCENSKVQKDENMNLYIYTKYVAEKALSKFSKFIDVLTCRYFFIYGPGQRAEMLIPRMLNNITNGAEISLASGRGPILNPIYSTDAARASIHLFENNQVGIFNIAGTEVYSLKDICEILGKKIGTTPKIKSNQETASDFISDISKILNLNFKCTVSLEEGIGKLVDHRKALQCAA